MHIMYKYAAFIDTFPLSANLNWSWAAHFRGFSEIERTPSAQLNGFNDSTQYRKCLVLFCIRELL